MARTQKLLEGFLGTQLSRRRSKGSSATKKRVGRGLLSRRRGEVLHTRVHVSGMAVDLVEGDSGGPCEQLHLLAVAESLSNSPT